MSPKPPGEPRLPIFVDVAYHLMEVEVVVRDCNEIVVPDEKQNRDCVIFPGGASASPGWPVALPLRP